MFLEAAMRSVQITEAKATFSLVIPAGTTEAWAWVLERPLDFVPHEK